jgi:hypothetical protein
MLSALLVLLAFLLGFVAGRLSLLVVSDVEKAIAKAERDEERWVG